MPISQEPRAQQGDGDKPGGETVVFDNLQSQDDNDNDQANDEGEGLKAPLSFVLDDCPFGPGVMTVLKSMSRGEQCEAWLDPKHGPGEKGMLRRSLQPCRLLPRGFSSSIQILHGFGLTAKPVASLV